MALKRDEKKTLIEDFRTHEADTGSPEIQIALLTRRIDDLSKHLKVHSKDFHSRRGLLIMVSRRKRLIGYLKRVDFNRYRSVIERLRLRK